MRTRKLFAVAGLFSFICLAATAQEPKLDLPPDVVPSNFRMYLVTDTRFEPPKDADGKPLKGPDGKAMQSPKNRQGKLHCLVCEYGLNPVVAIFVRPEAKVLGGDSGVAKLIKGLNAAIPKNRFDKLAGFVAFLNLEGGTKVVTIKTKKPDGTDAEEKIEQDKEYPDDEKRDVYANDIRAFANALNAPHVPFGLAPTKAKAITAWDVKEGDDVTVVVYYHMRKFGEVWRFKEFKDLTDEKVAEILKAAEASFVPKD